MIILALLDVGSCDGGTWSAWLDRDDPSGVCDCERIDHFWGDVEQNFCGSKYKELCVRPIGAQARIRGSTDLQTDQVVTFDMNGFRCENADQTKGSCKDYEIEEYKNV